MTETNAAAEAGPGGTSGTGGTKGNDPAPKRSRRPGDLNHLLRRTLTANESWTFIALVILMAVFTGLAPGKFLTTSDLSLISQTTAPLLVMAIGETFVILTAGIDLSVGFVLVLSGVVAGEYYVHNGGANAGVGTILVGVVVGLATGGGYGLLQGFMVAKLK
ncbi:MAG TPA: hypothetical protein VH089_27755, partial [Streptosporangiaceae bacterium]|nr:hypothetical protein [Streptosporangiaceae bacterium]